LRRLDYFSKRNLTREDFYLYAKGKFEVFLVAKLALKKVIEKGVTTIYLAIIVIHRFE